MDKSQFPQEDDFLPQDVPSVPTDDVLPEEPEILALSFTQDPGEAPQSVPVFPEPEDEASLLPEEPLGEEEPLFPQAFPFQDMDASVPSDVEPVPEAPGEPDNLQDRSLESPDLGVPAASDEAPMDLQNILEEIPEAASFALLNDPIPDMPQKVPALPKEPAIQPIPEAPPADQASQNDGKDPGKRAEAPAHKPHPRPPRKGRPKRKKGEGLLGIPNILTTIVWLSLILAIGVTAGRMLWVCAADVLAFGRENKPVTVTVYESDTMETITDKLYNAGLIRYKSLFNLYASISDAEEKIRPGIYDLNTLYDYHALVNFMTPRSSREVIELTIPEGYTCRQIFELLEENRVCTAVDAASYAASGELKDYWFLENVARGDKYCLEGYLFPDTYEFYKNSTPREALERMLNNFENRFSEEMRAQIDELNENVTGGGYTVREVTIVASLIEKESAAPAESPAIAGVIYNRLHRWDGTPAYLNIDAAIVYAQDGNAETIDTHLDSPYNTYTHTGLTPTPISNPGIASLQAALQPENHGYYYYVLNPSTGMHQFSATQEEHNANIAAFYG